ncbi:MAG: FliM/FliN family flagellar motor switch protein [Thermoguttaceae bacterium]|nr:FliM/FliN family flagellar motor switch protein [Thermoguttaceae bacterium]
MNERLPDFAAASFSYWNDVERRLDAILRRSGKRLDALTSDANVQALRRSLGDFAEREPAPPVRYSLELGRVRLTADELDALGPESIVPLSSACDGAAVQIWANGRLQGRGVLLVVDGKLAVRVEEIDPY